MLWLVIKSLISGALVGIVSETAKRSAAMGALVASLPIVSVLGMVWLWQETKECCQTKRIGLERPEATLDHATS